MLPRKVTIRYIGSSKQGAKEGYSKVPRKATVRFREESNKVHMNVNILCLGRLN